ncbi:hypothetical protein KIK06_15080 [Nocardiopsis sp. EMB25]|uniref:hypothetical protein n=1 Tax=Nocardiopsis sp. EMB25 TaxID=2835867 RepID=UPI002284E8B3|nr:hypothetical protein [Nocardiopsis sp. EMB25]MCY9785206.1 hypothetical protein [Nocardiopsis sp. EMB25]
MEDEFDDPVEAIRDQEWWDGLSPSERALVDLLTDRLVDAEWDSTYAPHLK